MVYNKFMDSQLYERAVSPDLATMGSRIKALRESKHLTQEEFGKMFGLVKSTVSLYEHDKSTPNDEIKKAICNSFGVSMDFLLGLSSFPQALTNGTFFFTFDNSLAEAITRFGIQPLSKEAGIAESRLKELIDGDAPTSQEIVAISDSVGVSVDDLIGHSTKSKKNREPALEGQTLSPVQQDLLKSVEDFSADETKKVREYAEFLKSQRKE